MTSAERITIIQERLQKAFSPSMLQVLDDSEHHKGHEGARGGAGHYTVQISALIFQDKTRIEAHRMIYSVLQDLIPHEIHALQIKIIKT